MRGNTSGLNICEKMICVYEVNGSNVWGIFLMAWGGGGGGAFLVFEKQAKGKWLKAKGERSRCAQSCLDAAREIGVPEMA